MRWWRQGRAAAVAAVVALVALIVPPVPPAGAAPANVAVSPVDDGLDYQQPSLAWDRAHPRRLAIAYMEGSRRQVCGLGRSTDGGDAWRSEVLVGPGGRLPIPEGFAACWNPSVTYGPDGTLYYLFQTSLLASNPYSHVFVTASGDNGDTFSPPVAVDPASPTYPGLRGGGDWWPSMAVDPGSGALYVTWSRFTALLDTSQVVVSASADGGRTFTQPVRVSPADQIHVTGSLLAVGADGGVHLAWLDYTQWERGAFTADGSANYSNAELLTALPKLYEDAGSRLDFTQGVGCTTFAGPSYRGGRGGGGCVLPATLSTAASTDGAKTFSAAGGPDRGVHLGCPAPLFTTGRPPSGQHHCDRLHTSFYDHNVHALTAGSRPGQLVTAWWDTGAPVDTVVAAARAEAPARVAVAESGDAGVSWQTQAAVGVLAGGQQHRPALSVAPDGRLDIAYYNLTVDGTQDVYSVSVSASAPGDPFAPPARITSRPSDGSVGPKGDEGRASFGNHLAVASTNREVFVAWTDTRSEHGHQAVYFAAHAVGRGGTPMARIVALGAAAAIAAAAAVVLRRRRRAASRVSGRPAGG